MRVNAAPRTYSLRRMNASLNALLPGTVGSGGRVAQDAALSC